MRVNHGIAIMWFGLKLSNEVGLGLGGCLLLERSVFCVLYCGTVAELAVFTISKAHKCSK